MIAEAAMSFLRENYPGAAVQEIERDDGIRNMDTICGQVGPDDILFFIGGGNLGNYWPKNEDLRQGMIKRFPDHKKIILPQSIQYTDDEEGASALIQAKEIYSDRNLFLACRGKVSYEFARQHFACNVILTPDMVMYDKLPSWWRNQGTRKGIILCLRDDKESALCPSEKEEIERKLREACEKRELRHLDMVSPYPVKPRDRRSELARQYRTLSGAEIVVTDRLHCMIFCAQTETPCVVFPNNHHKISECYEWIKEIPYICMIQDITSLSAAFREVMNVRKREYPLLDIRSAFSELKYVL